ncbi:DNA topoisomerase 2 [Frankliniella fusca]|uniref:DNA topoisomerase 2 n=1 Tax=Frankliniella fusca TaxID=407009 RepID=A0AAE1I060_9NEOP|nr:DNA topoisomerase 2 [Frankliniella fusca]
MSDEEYMANGGGGGGGHPKKKLTVEKIYQKKSQLEHILLRPDTYIGSVEPVTENMWVYDRQNEVMVQKDVTYVPGLYKIFDEILVNAADNKQRDKKMDCIKITIDPEQNLISVWNNGQGIPVVEHKEEKMYVPTMIFGHLLTSSNYDDDEKKVTGGRNGYGAKLCNIFSTKFVVETSSKEYGLQLKQTWGNNMGKAGEPRLSKATGEDYTKITFSPDLSKFKMDSLTEGIVQLMERRAFDVAASTRGVKVYLNGERIKITNFKQYCELYLKGKEDDVGNPLKIIYENVNERWEVAVAISDKGFQQVSFVNSIATTKGGRHVDHVSDNIVKNITEVLKKRNKGGMQIKPHQIKNHMFIFINCLIVNPTFDSQTKENMTLQMKSFGSKCEMSPAFYNNIAKSGIVEAVLTWAKFKQQTQLNKIGGKKSSRLKGVPKLEDANDAGTKNSIECTLILTEGDSAKTLAVSGLGVVGRDRYGVFPLRGKLLNVREASHKQIMENAEINALIKIIGLQHKKKYESVDDLKTLRYGKVMIMTDQDQDGSHIKGLLINFIHYFWPSLLRLPFLEEFITPIVKARKGNDVLSFFSLPEFEEWKKETNNWHTWRIKYYKGLGTSDSKEAKEYFSDMDRHRIKFNYKGTEDDNNICMAFAKKEVEKRKEWLTNWMESSKRRQELGLPEEYLYGKTTKIKFVNKELVLFSNMDNERSIPNLIDGFKPGQRKVIYTCLKRNDKREVKVAQLAGSVAEQSAYHHGEVSLMSTIVNLAQNYVGSNNINLLMPNGQFGTRLTGGKDSASPRYIFTMLSKLAKAIYHPSDTPLLKNLYDDNQKIEPQWFCPIIPMVLVNGADGIGTGWMTKVPNHNPREIVQNIKRMIRGDEPVPMKPWYKNFKGVIHSVGDSRYLFFGEVAVIDEEKVEITELPVHTWTTAYKESVLEPMLNPPGDKGTPFITDYKDYCTDTTVRFVVSLPRANLEKAEREGLHKTFKLQATMSISSMCLFDEMNCLRRFESATQILKEHYRVRFDMYKKRKAYMEGLLEAEGRKLSNQARFILEKCSNKLVIENKKKVEMIKELKARGYDPDPEREEENAGADTADDSPEDDEAVSYSYLLGMTLWSLTLEKKEELLKKRDDKLQELKDLQRKTPADLWEIDLDALLELMDKCEEEEQKEASKIVPKKQKGAVGRVKKIATNDTIPDPLARRVVPELDEDMKTKYIKLDAAKSRPPGVKGRKRKGDGEPAEEKDDIDRLIQGASKSLKDRIGTSPDAIEKKAKGGLKQSKLNFKKTSPAKKKRNSDDSDVTDDEDIFRDDSPSPAKDRGPKRTAATKANFKKMLASDDSDSDGYGFKDSNGDAEKIVVSDTDSDFDDRKVDKKKTAVSTKPKLQQKPAASSESEEEGVFAEKPKPIKAGPSRPSSDQMFDSLMRGSTDSQEEEEIAVKMPPTSKVLESTSDSEEPKKKKAPAKKRQLLAVEKPEKKKAPPKKKPKKGSDSEDDIFEVGKKKNKKKADSDSDFEMSEQKASSKATTGRSRKPVSYNFGDSDSD